MFIFFYNNKMSTLVSLYRDINLLLDMVESRMQQFKDLCKKKIQATASVQESTEVKEVNEVKDIKEHVGNTEAKKKHKKKEEVPETARYVSLPSGNFLIFN